MDPVACLAEAKVFYDDDEFSQALARLADYFEWRLKGGFQPPRGDIKALALQNLICDCMEA